MDRFARWLEITPHRVRFILIGLMLSTAAFAATGDNAVAISRIAAPLWLTGIALTIIGCWKTSPPQEHKHWDRWEIAVVIALTLASFILRAWGADHMPYVLSGDEGSAGLTAWEFLNGRRSNILGLGWFSFPSLYFWILSLSQRVLGRTVIAIRWVSAIGGALTIPALYWACRSLFNRRVALLSAAWLMAFHHHIFFSRVAYNNIWDGLFFVLALGALWNAWEFNDRRSFLLAGLAIGFAQYFYTTSRLIPILLVLWMIWLARRGGGWKSRLPEIVCLVLATLSVSLPLVLLYLRHPESLFFTASRVSMLIPGWRTGVRANLGNCTRFDRRRDPRGLLWLRNPHVDRSFGMDLLHRSYLLCDTFPRCPLRLDPDHHPDRTPCRWIEHPSAKRATNALSLSDSGDPNCIYT